MISGEKGAGLSYLESNWVVAGDGQALEGGPKQDLSQETVLR
jgi:hypothetical protein